MTQRAGLVAVVGAPNAGKSTLVNALVGQKVAIVTPKAQTTRTRLMGIAMHGESQVLLVDTPGCSSPSAGSTARWSPRSGKAPRMRT
jgi:GTP-binding protein Era